MKKLANLKGAKALSRTQQKEIFGGDPIPHGDGQGGSGGGGGSGSCTAQCQGGGAVSCSGYTCGAEDDYGCESWDENNNTIEEKFCPEA